jgi:hypothetical protein
MFRTERDRTLADLISSLDAWERDSADLERLIRCAHPEWMTTQEFYVLRSIFLTHSKSMRTFVSALREYFNGRSNPPGDYRGRD